MEIRSATILFVFGIVAATDCPDGWVAYEGSCYLFGVDKVHFTEAEHYCGQHQAYVVHVETKEENMFLKGFIQSYLNDDYWIGMTDEIVEGLWKWYGTDSTIEFSDWGPNEPLNVGSGEDCAMFSTYRQLQWADVPCIDNYKALCEKRVATEIIG